jgi:hypothetical protein
MYNHHGCSRKSYIMGWGHWKALYVDNAWVMVLQHYVIKLYDI